MSSSSILPTSSAAGQGNAITNSDQLPLFPTTPVIIPKCVHAGTDWVGQPYIFMDQAAVAMRSKLGLGIVVDNVFGTTISGPTAIFENLENIHVGAGYWTFNPAQLESIGSSSAIPIPTFVPSTPRLLYAAQQVSNSVSQLQSADPSIPGVS